MENASKSSMAATASRRAFLRNAAIGAAGLSGLSSSLLGAAPLATKVTINPPSVFAAVYYLGISEGIWAKHDWDITDFVPAGAGGTAVRTVATGGILVGEVSATAAFQAWTVGAPIRIVTLSINKPTELLYVGRPDTTIAKPNDLIGKKLGYTGPAGATHAAAVLAVERLGLTGKVELIATGGIREGLALLERGEIDVASQLESVVKASDKFKTIWRVTDFVPKYAYSAIIVGEAFAKREPERVASFLRARNEALNLLKMNPEAAANAWLKATRGHELESLLRTVKAMNAAQAWISTGWDVEAVQASLRSMELIGSIPNAKNVPLAEMLDQTFVDPANQVKL